VIKCGGKLIIGLIDKNSTIGKLYQKYRKQNVFYQYATFYSPDEVTFLMKQSGFFEFYFTQTIFRMLDEINKPEIAKAGYGEGSFVVISGLKKCTKK
jgi:hypothetical protein